MQTTPTPPPTGVKRATAGFAISFVAGIIILINALLFLVAASFLGSFGSMIPSLPGVPAVTEAAIAVVTMFGAAGLIFSIIVIVGAILIYMPGKEIIGGILVLIFSLFSIVIGGGFILGLILGIIGGALGIAKK